MDERCLSTWSCWSASRVDQPAMTRTLNNPFMRFSVQLSDEETAWSSSQRKTLIVGIYEVLGRPLTDLTNPGVEGCQKVRHGGITGLPRGNHKPAPCSDAICNTIWTRSGLRSRSVHTFIDSVARMLAICSPNIHLAFSKAWVTCSCVLSVRSVLWSTSQEERQLGRSPRSAH